MKGKTRPCGLNLSQNSLGFKLSTTGLPPKEMAEPHRSLKVDLSISINLNVLHIKGGKKEIVADVIGFPIMLRTKFFPYDHYSLDFLISNHFFLPPVHEILANLRHSFE